MAAKPKTYGEAHAAGVKLLSEARLNDPGEHFPYKHDVVIALLEDNPPMGPGVPDGVDGTDDRSREAADYMSRDIADASADYIDAQAAYLADPSASNKAAYEAARDQLQAARLDHRQGRGAGFTVGAAARRAG